MTADSTMSINRRPSTNPNIKISPSSSSFSPQKILTLGGLLSAIYVLFTALDAKRSSFYIFDHVKLQEMCQSAIATHGNDTYLIVNELITTLATQHPSYTINTNFALPSSSKEPTTLATYVPNESEWMFNNAGGAMGTMFLIHASITEYLIIFGTPLGTEGHSGRHTADDYFTIIHGEQWASGEGALDKEIYRAGDQHHLKRGTVKQYKFHDGGFALELAQGWIPPMIAFGFADGLTSTLDIPTLWKTSYITGREMIKNLLNGKI